MPFASDREDLTICGVPASRLAPAGEIKLPKVTFIVRNWNYGRYIGSAIDSIRSQDYPNFEAIIVDNASTDDSRDIIERHVGNDPRFRVIHSEINLGPLGGGLRALDHATGDFVAFIDSDDALLSNFASAHIQVHLASRHNVAFSSSSAMETGPGGAMLNGRRTRSATLREEPIDSLRSAEVVPRLRTIDDETYAVLARHTRLLPPVAVAWPWSPGSSNMYRRFVLAMLAPQCDSNDLTKLAADGHYNHLAHLLGGSVVIDLPLSTYRIHGNNFAASTPSLTSMGGDAGPATKFHAVRAREMIRVLTANATDFSMRIGEKRYWRALGALFDLGGLNSAADRTEWNRDDYFCCQIRHLAASFGERRTLRKLAEIVPTSLLREGVRTLHGPNLPGRIQLELIFSPLRRLRFRLKGAIRKRRAKRSAHAG